MADPFYFPAFDGGGFADTRRELRLPARVDRERAMSQWRALAEALQGVGFDVYAIGPEKENPGLAFVGGSALIPRADDDSPLSRKTVVRATFPPARRGDQAIYERTLRDFGFEVSAFDERFGASADVMRCGERWLFTFGPTHGARLALWPAFPPWRKMHGFGTDATLRERVARLVSVSGTGVSPVTHKQPQTRRLCHSLRLVDPAFPHGDTSLCPIGPGERALMVYLDALDDDARRMALSDRLAEHIIPLERKDAIRRAANAVQVVRPDRSCVLLCPAGVSDDLAARIEGVGVELLQIEVDEFLKRGGGVRRLVQDLGLIRDDHHTQTAEARDFRQRLRLAPIHASQAGA